MFVKGSGQNVQSLERTTHRCFIPSVGSFGQTVSEEKNFKNQSIRNKNRLWRPSLLTNQDEMSTFYRGPSIGASYQVSVHLAKRFQRRRFFLIGQSETRIAYGGHVCWWIGTKWAIFHRCFLPSFTSFGWAVSEEKIKMWKVNGWQTPSDGKSLLCLWQGELKKTSSHTF